MIETVDVQNAWVKSRKLEHSPQDLTPLSIEFDMWLDHQWRAAAVNALSILAYDPDVRLSRRARETIMRRARAISEVGDKRRKESGA